MLYAALVVEIFHPNAELYNAGIPESLVLGRLVQSSGGLSRKCGCCDRNFG